MNYVSSVMRQQFGKSVENSGWSIPRNSVKAKSAFWLFLWNTVYDKDREVPLVDDTTTHYKFVPRGCSTVATQVADTKVAETQVVREMMENFSTIKIGLISKEDCFSKNSDKSIHCQQDLIFGNGSPCQWTVDRCKHFQDILTSDCVLKKRVSRPIVVPVQHLILKLPKNFVAGFYTIGVVGCCERLAESRGMYLTARDADAQHVFETDVLDHKGSGWVWNDMTEYGTEADLHSFSNLHEDKFLCEKEPGKEKDEGDDAPDEFGRRTIWIGLPQAHVGSHNQRPQTYMGGFGENVPPGYGSKWFQKDRIPQGHIAAIGMELRTHDDQDVEILCDDIKTRTSLE